MNPLYVLRNRLACCVVSFLFLLGTHSALSQAPYGLPSSFGMGPYGDTATYNNNEEYPAWSFEGGSPYRLITLSRPEPGDVWSFHFEHDGEPAERNATFTWNGSQFEFTDGDLTYSENDNWFNDSYFDTSSFPNPTPTPSDSERLEQIQTEANTARRFLTVIGGMFFGLTLMGVIFRWI